MRAFVTALILAAGYFAAAGPVLADEDMARLPAGDYPPFYKFSAGLGKTALETRPIQVSAFRLDRTPVTNSQFLRFVRANSEWRRSQAKSLFVDRRYLAKWRGDLAPPPGEMDAPVTQVSWFAAQAFCEAGGRRLPTTDEWEYALNDGGRDREAVVQRSIDWFGARNPPVLPAVGGAPPNRFGLRDMVGLVWEWTEDFSSAGPSSEQRNTASEDGAQFCSGAALGVRDATDYPAFMRYALRSSLKAGYTQANLGFRCAGDM